MIRDAGPAATHQMPSDHPHATMQLQSADDTDVERIDHSTFTDCAVESQTVAEYHTYCRKV